MDADLLSKFAPVLYMEKDEKVGPCTFEQYVDGSSLFDTQYEKKLAEPGEWLLSDHADNASLRMNFERAAWLPEDSLDAPIYAVCSTVREGSKAYYSLLYMALFPVSVALPGDMDKMAKQWCDLAHVRVHVDCHTMKIAKVYFPGYGNGGGWVLPEQATYADTDKRHVAVYVGEGTHSMNPRKGTVWRAGGTQFTDPCRGTGVKWSPTPVALPGFLSAWKGELAEGVPTPQQSQWFLKEDHKTGDELLARTLPPCP